MTQENKEILLQDLCARLPYGVKIELMPITRGKCTTLTPLKIFDYYISDDVNYLPYLFPLSSMTEEQEKECQQIKYSYYFHDDSFVLFDWYNKNHFDYRGLIPMGLAIDATGLKIY